MQKTTASILSLIFTINIFWAAISFASEDNSPSYISITSNMNGATVYLNSEIVGTTPIEHPIAVESGYHSIKARKDGYSTTWREEMFIAPGETAKVKAIMVPLTPIDPVTLKPRKKPYHKTWWFGTIVLIGIGLAIHSAGDGGNNGSFKGDW